MDTLRPTRNDRYMIKNWRGFVALSLQGNRRIFLFSGGSVGLLQGPLSQLPPSMSHFRWFCSGFPSSALCTSEGGLETSSTAIHATRPFWTPQAMEISKCEATEVCRKTQKSTEIGVARAKNTEKTCDKTLLFRRQDDSLQLERGPLPY